jgi:hypothetical protein
MSLIWRPTRQPEIALQRPVATSSESTTIGFGSAFRGCRGRRSSSSSTGARRASYFLDQRLRGGDVREIGPDDVVDFRAPGVERFVTSFKLCIEGKFYRWSEPTITREQIAALGGWNVSEGVVQIDDDQNEVTLNPNQVVTLGPGCSFGKKMRWKRG